MPARPSTAALAALLALATGCSRSTSPATPPEPPPITLGAENVARVEARTLQSGPAVSGSLRPRREATLRAELGGALLANDAEPGREVKKGELLARVEDRALGDQLSAAEQAVRAADHALDLARRTHARSRSLAEAGSIAAQALEQSETAVAAQEALAADARARLAGARQVHDRTRLRAPFDGIVSDRQARAGDVVQPGTALFTVVDPTSMRLEAAVPAQDLGAIRPGTAVDFGVSGYAGRSFSGHIEQVNPVVDAATGQVRITVTLPNVDGTLLAGLFAKGRVATDTRTVPAVPADAVDASTTPPSVLRVREGRLERVAVEVGIRDEVAERVEIRRGLVPGDLVLRGSARAGIAEGARVQVGTDVAGR